jgi:hypothetical protein
MSRASEYMQRARQCRELAAVLSRADERERVLEEARRYEALAQEQRSFSPDAPSD